MKRFLLIVLIILVSAFILLRVVKEKVGNDLAQTVQDPAVSSSPTVVLDRSQKTNTSLFVPDWALDTIPGDYDQYIYFGITPTKNGIDATASGTQGVDSFNDAMPEGKQTLLALRMVDADTNDAILHNKTLQQQIASQAVAFAKEHGFSGIVLDLELSGIPFDSLVGEINSFVSQLDNQAKTQQLQFDVTLYGDTFYRLRPFTVKTIAANSDRIMIMAYDFHKSRSNPGPNFPLSGQDSYGYDMGKMADDFLQAVPNQKLVVIFGLYGYDWPVDAQGNAMGQGKALTYGQIRTKFLEGCSFKNCQVKRDSLSAETEIHYTDDANQRHIVWFEDMQSVTKKEQFLRKKGIGNFSFWANSYF